LGVTKTTFIYILIAIISLETTLKIIEQWKVDQIQLNPPATLEAIRRAEGITGYTFPPDFKAIYLLADGFKDYDWTPNMFSLWSLQRKPPGKYI
jgi:cell wall assembly regulator SMI1